MKRLMVGIGFVLFLWSAKSCAQSGAVIPQAEAARVSPASCVILKRIGRIGRTESRLTHFGISGKQFRYVEGQLPEGFSRHRKMTDHDVRKLQSRGAQVLVLDSHYKAEDLQEARADCQKGSKTPNQVEAKAASAQAPATVANSSTPASKPPAMKLPSANALTPAPGPAPGIASASAAASKPSTTNPATTNSAPAAEVAASTDAPAPKPRDAAPPADTTVAALLDVSSTPAGADVYVDDRLSGHTPATTIILMPGDHRIIVKKSGFAVWKKKLKLPSGPTSLNAQLLPK